MQPGYRPAQPTMHPNADCTEQDRPPPMTAVSWRGSETEYGRLEDAVNRNCECVAEMLGLPPIVCPGHLMLEQQSTIDHLLYVYRTRHSFVTREFCVDPLQTSTPTARMPAT
jgi:hypothetical protein